MRDAKEEVEVDLEISSFSTSFKFLSFFILIGLIASAISLFLIRAEVQLRLSRIEVPGKIVKITKSRCRSKQINKCYQSIVAYTFIGKEYQSELAVTSFSRVGQEDVLLVDPKTPSFPEFKYSFGHFFFLVFYLILLIFGIIFIAIGVFMFIKDMKRKRLIVQKQ